MARLAKSSKRTRFLKLGRLTLQSQLEERYQRETILRNKARLLCVKLAASGRYSAAEIARQCGCSRASVFNWTKAFQTGSYAKLLKREKPGPHQGQRRGISQDLSRELDAGWRGGRWPTVEAARNWLLEQHGIRKSYITLWSWRKKSQLNPV